MTTVIRLGALTALIALLLVVQAAPVAVAEDSEYPVLSNFSVVPHSLGWQGGPVTITADATDDVAVTGVGATVYFADGGAVGVALAVTTSEAPNTYSGTVEIPANYSDEPVGHSVEVSATDSAGETTLELMGWIDVEGQPVFDQAPYVFDATVAPSTLPSGGGTVTIGATATDDRSVSEVYAVVTDAGGGQTYLPLDPVGADRYQSTWSTPANLGTDPHSYSVMITALDDIGQSGEVDAGVVTVAGMAPPFVDLEVSRVKLVFGPQPRDTASFRTITVTNTGTESATVTLILRGRRFVITASRKASFELRPGDTRRVTVRYQSARPGRHHQWLRMTSDYETQSSLRVRLVGRTTQLISPSHAVLGSSTAHQFGSAGRSHEQAYERRKPWSGPAIACPLVEEVAAHHVRWPRSCSTVPLRAGLCRRRARTPEHTPSVTTVRLDLWWSFALPTIW